MPTLRCSMLRLTGCSFSLMTSFILCSLMENASALSTHRQELDLYAREFPKAMINAAQILANEKSEEDLKMPTLENRIVQMLLGVQNGLEDSELPTVDRLEEMLPAPPTSKDLDGENTPTIRHRKQFSAMKMKRQPIQCLVNVVSCWK